MQKWFVGFVCMAIFVGMLGVPASLEACTPSYCMFTIGERTIMPTAGRKEVPTNTQIRLLYTFCLDFREGQVAPPPAMMLWDIQLRPQGGKAVVLEKPSLSEQPLPAHLVVLRPVSPLQPHTVYEILTRFPSLPCHHQQPGCFSADYQVASTFETGAGQDNTSPRFAGLKAIQTKFYSYDTTCGSYTELVFTLRCLAGNEDSNTVAQSFYLNCTPPDVEEVGKERHPPDASPEEGREGEQVGREGEPATNAQETLPESKTDISETRLESDGSFNAIGCPGCALSNQNEPSERWGLWCILWGMVIIFFPCCRHRSTK